MTSHRNQAFAKTITLVDVIVRSITTSVTVTVMRTLAACAMLFSAPFTHAQETDDAAAGRELYVRYQCWQCHGYEGQGGAAPRLAGRDYPFAAFERFVRHPREMPAYSPAVLPDADLQRILGFLRSLPEPPAID